MNQAMQKPIAELAYEIEKSVLNLQAVHMMAEAGLIQNSIIKEVENKINLHSELLVKAQDILTLVPKHVVSAELKYIRLSQFNEVYKTKADVLDYLKKKYA